MLTNTTFKQKQRQILGQMLQVHLRGLVTERCARETQQGLIDALLLTDLIAVLVPNPFLQHAQHPLALQFALDRETKPSIFETLAKHQLVADTS